MDIIQQIMTVFIELIDKMKKIFFFVNSQFLPMTEDNNTDKSDVK